MESNSPIDLAKGKAKLFVDEKTKPDVFDVAKHSFILESGMKFKSARAPRQSPSMKDVSLSAFGQKHKTLH